MSTKQEGDNSFEKIGPDEPFFILRAHDKIAPVVVRLWAHSARMHGVPQSKVEEARQLADRMDLWQSINGSKVPD